MSRDGALDRAFWDEVALANRRRTLVLVPVLLAVHVLHVVAFHVPADRRAAMPVATLAWHDGVVATHAVTATAALLICAVLWRWPSPRVASIVTPLTAALYALHAAALGCIDQLASPSITPFVGACMALAVIYAFPFAVTSLIYAAALATLTAGTLVVQTTTSARLTVLSNGGSFVAVGLALAWGLLRARRRDYAQRQTIDQQRAALAELNEGLERRVTEQVAEIVARADEVGRLNAQLQAKVRARSAELSTALSKLARQYHEDGTIRRGTVLAERFEVGTLLGAGGMGSVYAGRDLTSGGDVAIKVSQASSSDQLDAWRRFLREAETTATLDHPGIVRVLHVDVSDEGMLFQVQERVEGDTLQSRLRSGERWDEGVAARLGAVLCGALATAHDRGVTHRDVKPANVMLTRAAPGLKLVDFGIAKLRAESQPPEGATQTGAILGTPIYMSPEQIHGAPVDGRSDVYAVGVVLFLLVSGKLPFDGATPRGAMMSSLLDQAPDLRVLAPMASPDLAEVVARCLRKDPDGRPTARELGEVLGAFADARGVEPLEVLEREGALHDDRARASSSAGTVVAAPRARVGDSAVASKGDPTTVPRVGAARGQGA